MNVHSQGLEPAAVRRTDDPRRDIRIGAAIAFLFFVVLLGWAALTPLDAAARATGSVAVLGNRQAVQHPTGGVVTAIHVREGQRVEAGQLLIEMAAPETRAAERALTSDYLNLLAQRSRLLAERTGASSFSVPIEFQSLEPRDRALAQQAMRLQLAQMRARSGSMGAQQGVLEQRVRQLREQQSGYARQRESMVEQQQLLEDELTGLREVAKKGFASTNRVRALERAQAELRGQQAALTAEIARAGEGVGETRMQGLSLSRETIEEIATEMRDTEAKLSEVLPKLVAVREQLQHSQVRSPASGQVVGMSVFTVGGVVSPGQVLMEIVPENKLLIVQAKVSPSDADDVYPGQEAQLRFLSVGDRTLPLITGTVRTISADSFTDEKTGETFFRAEIGVGPKELERIQEGLGRGQLKPGLPVEAMLKVRKRTALQYILEPLTLSFSRSLHEQ